MTHQVKPPERIAATATPRFPDYALRVLMYAAEHDGRKVKIAEIARVHDVSQNHLMKVVNRLAQLEFLTTVRGRSGSITLGRPAADISIGAIIRALEPLTIVECFASGSGRDCCLAPRCALARAMQKALADFLTALDGFTLADVSKSVRSPRRFLASVGF